MENQDLEKAEKALEGYARAFGQHCLDEIVTDKQLGSFLGIEKIIVTDKSYQSFTNQSSNTTKH